MILADENVSGTIIKELVSAGIEVLAVSEVAQGVKDEQVIEIAVERNLLLLTEDKDFGEWVFAHHVKDLSVLFIRYSFPETHEMAATLIALLKRDQFERPFFATITPKKIRIRKL